jgi:phosphotriesterase-related protein
MSVVQTVTGPIDSAALGRVLVHEHVFVLDEEYRQNYLPDWDDAAMTAQAVRDLTELKQLGIDTILDPTVLGLGRSIPRIKTVAEQVELNIVAATGLYTYRDVPFQFMLVGPGLMIDVADPLPEIFIRDITEGIADTGVRAAFLKCAIDHPGLTEGVERVLRAVGQASVATGAPITVHTDSASQSGLIAQRVLAEEGVDLANVIIGHSGDTTDLDYLMRVADAGSILGMDRFGLDLLLPLEQRINTVVELVARGYADRVTLSHDSGCFADFFSPQQQHRQLMPDYNFQTISRKVLPALLTAGVTDAQIQAMLVDNPRRYFEGAAGSA